MNIDWKKIKEVGDAVSTWATVAGVGVAVLFFGIQIFFQKSLQNLSPDVSLKITKGADDADYLKIELCIKNESPVRINLQDVKYEFFFYKENKRNYKDYQRLSGCFQSNLNESANSLISVDGKSSVTLQEVVLLPKTKKNDSLLWISCTFVPIYTNDKYIINRLVPLGEAKKPVSSEFQEWLRKMSKEF